METAAVRSKAHNGLFLDLFPYNSFPETPADRRAQGRKIMRYRKTMMMKSRTTPWLRNKNIIKLVGVFVKYLPYRILAFFSDREKIKVKYNPVMVAFNHLDTEYVYELSGGATYGTVIIPRKCFDTFVSLPFEDTYFSCPGDSDLYLKSVYGDYMTLPPENKRVTHLPVQIKL